MSKEEIDTVYCLELEKAYILLLSNDTKRRLKHKEHCKNYYSKTNIIKATNTDDEVIEIVKTKQKRLDYQKVYYAKNKSRLLEKQKQNYKSKKTITSEIGT